MTEELEIYLSGCQVGITVASIGLGVVAEPALSAVFAPAFVAAGLAPPGSHPAIASVTAFALMNVFHVVIGEQAPTYFGVERTKTAARYGARPLYYWTRVLSPFISVADWCAKWILRRFGIEMARSWAEEEVEDEGVSSRADLKVRMGEVLGASELPADREQEVLAALEIGSILVSDIMVPVEDAVFLRTGDDIETNLERIRDNPHTRFPLVGPTLDDYEGAVYVPAVLRNLDELRTGELDLRDCSGDPLKIAPDTAVSDAIDRFQDAGEELALVMNGDEAVGLLTPTDAWETITGEQTDPLDAVS
jgi:CBS domain containing-hemolysin-like protein